MSLTCQIFWLLTSSNKYTTLLKTVNYISLILCTIHNSQKNPVFQVCSSSFISLNVSFTANRFLFYRLCTLTTVFKWSALGGHHELVWLLCGGCLFTSASRQTTPPCVCLTTKGFIGHTNHPDNCNNLRGILIDIKQINKIINTTKVIQGTLEFWHTIASQWPLKTSFKIMIWWGLCCVVSQLIICMSVFSRRVKSLLHTHT